MQNSEMIKVINVILPSSFRRAQVWYSTQGGELAFRPQPGLVGDEVARNVLQNITRRNPPHGNNLECRVPKLPFRAPKDLGGNRQAEREEFLPLLWQPIIVKTIAFVVFVNQQRFPVFLKDEGQLAWVGKGLRPRRKPSGILVHPQISNKPLARYTPFHLFNSKSA